MKAINFIILFCLLLLPCPRIALAAPGTGKPITQSIGTVYNVSTLTQLMHALTTANTAKTPATILLADGTYTLDIPMLHIDTPNLIIRSQTGHRNNVTLRGPDQGPNAVAHHIFLISQSNVTIADITLGWCRYHGIQVQGESPHNVFGLTVHNCRIVNCNEQFIKGSSSNTDPIGATDGIIENCLFEFTAGFGYQYYTGGIDIHKGVNWIVRDNLFKNIRNKNANKGIAEHAIHFWKRCPTKPQNIIIERNWIINCDRGIGLGLVNLAGGHNGGNSIIRNNMIYNDGTGTHADACITLEYADHVTIDNNTVYHATYRTPIEYRFEGSTHLTFRNNLTNHPIKQRDNAPDAILQNNLEHLDPSWFQNLSAGDLHIKPTATQIIDHAIPLSDFQTDIDNQKRPNQSQWDLGADEYYAPQDYSKP